MFGKTLFSAVISAFCLASSFSMAAEQKTPVLKGAGCIIQTEHGIVMSENNSGELQFPVGKRNNDPTWESVAKRETMEETGIDVTVGKLLQDWANVRFFSCTANTTIVFDKLVPPDVGEVKRVLAVNPHTMMDHNGQSIRVPWAAGCSSHGPPRQPHCTT